jgi:peroxiredoxin Q/BCP
LLCDTERELGLAYGACDAADARHAARISYWIGPDGTVRKAYAKVDPGTHVTTVLDDLRG